MKKFLYLLALASLGFAATAKELSEEPVARPEPFATHPVVMIVDYSERADDPEGAVSTAIRKCLKERASIVITTEHVLCILNERGNAGSPEEFQEWGILKKELNEQWIFRKTKNAVVLIPRSFRKIPELVDYDTKGDYKQLVKGSAPTKLELLLGVAVDHLERTDFAAQHAWACRPAERESIVGIMNPFHPQKMIDTSLLHSFQLGQECVNDIFISRTKYVNQGVPVPQFAFVIVGHGNNPPADAKKIESLLNMDLKNDETELQEALDEKDAEKAKTKSNMVAEDKKLIESVGQARIAGFTASAFVDLLNFFDQKLNTRFLLVISCFAGGRNLERVFVDTAKQVLRPYSFIIALGATTEAPMNIMAGYGHEYKKFFDLLTTKPELPDLEELLSAILGGISPRFNIVTVPLVKFPWSDQMFQLIDLPGKMVTLGKTLVWGRTEPLDINKFFGGRMVKKPSKTDPKGYELVKQGLIYPDLLLIYQRNYPFDMTLKINPDPNERLGHQPVFISMVQGPSYHTFKSFDLSDFEFASWLEKFLLQPLASKSAGSLEVEKVFFFKHLKIKETVKGAPESVRIRTLKDVLICHRFDPAQQLFSDFVIFKAEDGSYWDGAIKGRRMVSGVFQETTFKEITADEYNKILNDIEKDFKGFKEDIQILEPSFKKELSEILKKKEQKGPLPETKEEEPVTTGGKPEPLGKFAEALKALSGR